MTTDKSAEPDVDASIAELRRLAAELAIAVAAVRSVAQSRGVRIEVDPSGTIGDLRIDANAPRSNAELARVLVALHDQAHTESKQRATQLLRESDPRLHGPIRELTSEPTTRGHTPKPMSTQEMDQFYASYYPLGHHRRTNR